MTRLPLRLLEGRGLLISHDGEELRLTPDAPVSRPASTARVPAYIEPPKLELVA